MALVHTPAPELGSPCPDFQLPGVDGKIHTREELMKAQALVVMFICNHCPYVKAIEERLIQLGHDLKKMNVPLIGICSNDEKNYPEDSFENMKKRSEKMSYSFPYLQDKTQEVARKFGAVCTPDFFVYDAEGKLSYRGRLDDSWKEASRVTRRELFEAVQLLVAGKPPTREQLSSMGCSIKWISP